MFTISQIMLDVSLKVSKFQDFPHVTVTVIIHVTIGDAVAKRCIADRAAVLQCSPWLTSVTS